MQVQSSITHIPPVHYILKIESFSSFADNALEKYESGEFEAGGYKWKLILYPNGNKKENVKDHISLHLAMTNTSSFCLGWEVDVVFRLFLYDQKEDKFLIIQDAAEKERRFHGSKLQWGFDQFIPLNVFNDASHGYLVEDTCVFGAEVFVKDKLQRSLGKRECLSIIKNGNSIKHVSSVEAEVTVLEVPKVMK